MSQTVRPQPLPLRPGMLGLRRAAIVGCLIGMGAVSALWVWVEARAAGPASALAVPAGRAEAIVRRIEVAFADAQAVWARALQAQGKADYEKAEAVFFARTSQTPCMAEPVSGPYYCPDSGVVAFDLSYLDSLGERLNRQRELGISLYAARMSAMHLQRELGVLDRAAMELVGSRRGRRTEVAEALALQADCLAGVWAAAAEPRLGPVPEGFWGQLVWSSRNVVEDFGREGLAVPTDLDPFAAGGRAAREAAFTEGYAAGRIADCRLSLDGSGAG